jgi:hypothetical protein
LQPAGGFMSDRVEFDLVCPNNHNQTVTFSPEEFGCNRHRRNGR